MDSEPFESTSTSLGVTDAMESFVAQLSVIAVGLCVIGGSSGVLCCTPRQHKGSPVL